MKKNVFSRTLAVLASTAVLGAASMMSANAAGESLGLSSASGLPGSTVTLTVDVACGNNFESLDCVVGWDDSSLTGAKAVAASGLSGASEVGADYCTVVVYGSDAIADGSLATIDFTIPADAEPGTVYNVTFSQVNTFAIFGGEDIAATVPQSGGTITVEAPAPTDPDPTDPDPTDPPATETTAAPTTTTAKAATTGAPKTGTAGVAVAVAGLVTAGATAVVLKKRH